MKSNDLVLVTGATGFIGGRLAQRLLEEEGVRVRALVRTPTKAGWLSDLGAEIVAGDVTDPASVQAAMRGCNVVYHAAAFVSEKGAHDEVWAVNVDGTETVLDAAVDERVERFVQLSSCAVYGSLQQFDIDESTPTRLTGAVYHDSKVAAEELVLKRHGDGSLPVVAARPSQVYGLGSPQFTLRPLEAIRSGKMFLINGGRHMCKPIYIDNLIDGLIACAKSDAAVGEAINLTDGAPVAWRDFFGAYAAMLGVASLPSVPYSLAWLGAITLEAQEKITGKTASINRRTLRSLRSDNSFSNRNARELLDWTPRVDLNEGMRRTELWLRKNGYLGRVET